MFIRCKTISIAFIPVLSLIHMYTVYFRRHCTNIVYLTIRCKTLYDARCTSVGSTYVTSSAWFFLFDFDLWCFNATFSNISAISWRPVLVVEEVGVPGEKHRPWESNW